MSEQNNNHEQYEEERLDQDAPQVDSSSKTGSNLGKTKQNNLLKYFVLAGGSLLLLMMIYFAYKSHHKHTETKPDNSSVGGSVVTGDFKLQSQTNTPSSTDANNTPPPDGDPNNHSSGEHKIGDHSGDPQQQDSSFSRSLGGVMVASNNGGGRQNSDGTTEQGGSGIHYDTAAQEPPRLADNASSNDDSGKIGSAGNSDIYSGSAYKAGTVTKSKFDPNLLLEKGTYIPCVMRHAFNSNVDGQISCIVSDDVYSSAGTVKLIEKGSRVNGVYKGGNVNAGSQQMFVIWQEIRTPNNLVVNVDSGSADELGNAGLNGYVDYHWGIKLGMATLVSIVNVTGQNLSTQLAKNLGGNNSNSNSGSDDSTSVVTEILRQYANVRPTLYKNQGDKVGIFVARDIDFSTVYKLKAKRYE